MTVNLQCDGAVLEGPVVQQDAAFPSAVITIPFSLNPAVRCPGASTGRALRTISSPTAFVTLSGVGAADDVTQAFFVYMRVATGGFQFRVTYNNPLGSDIVSVLPSGGLFIHEPDAGGGFYVKKLEVQGAGTIEFYASGAQ